MPYSIPELAKRSIIPPNMERDHFPQEITLPETVITYAAETVQQAKIDGREQDMGFSFKNQRWVAGLSHPGERVCLEEGDVVRHGGRAALFFHVINRPEIAMHTRPAPKREITDKMAEAHFADREISEDRLAQAQETMWRHTLASYAVANCIDIESTYYRSHGTVGNMISTDSGLFLWIRRDTKHESTLHEDLFDKIKDTYNIGRNGRSIVRRNYQLWCKKLVLPSERDIAKLRIAYAQTAAATLSMHYACYMNDDPHNHTLNKITVNH